jgi:HTH-type transcriptional regulator, sugar sensing transcriptional regulator
MTTTNELAEKLIEYGLTSREASLYLASLELGESGMSTIAKRAKIKRPTAYLTFKTLEEKGLMGSLKMRNSLHFIATDPEMFFAREKRRIKELYDLLPKFKDVQLNKPSGTKIVSYEGKEAFKVVAEDSLRTPNSTIRFIGSLKELHNIVGEEYDINHYLPRRIKNNIFMKGLFFDNLTVGVKKLVGQENNQKELRETRYLPSKFYHETSTLIYDDRVIIFGGNKGQVVIMIENKDIAFSEQQKFDLIWDLSNKKIETTN